MRKSPKDVPRSLWLLFFVVLIENLLFLLFNNYLVPKESRIDPEYAFMAIWLFSFLLLTTIYFLLKIFSYQWRFTQTAASLLGIQIIIDVVRIVIILLGQISFMSSAIFTLLLFLTVPWALFVQTHILRHALSIPIITASFLSISLYLLWQLYFLMITDYLK